MQRHTSTWTHVVGERTFHVYEDWIEVPPPAGVIQYGPPPKKHVRQLVETATNEVIRTWESPPGGSLMPYDFSKNQAELEQVYAPRPSPGFASVPPIPEVGQVDANGWRCVELRSDSYGGNSPPIATWTRYDDATRMRVVQKRQAGVVLSEEKVPEGVAYISSGNITANGNWTINTASFSSYAPHAKETVPGGVVPVEAKYFEQCKYGGYCHYCEKRIAVGEAIWWQARGDLQKSRIWCGKHKDSPAATASGSGNTNTENDMAQRHDFTFPYTGAEIAASLERKAAKLDAEQKPAVRIDRETAALLGYSTDAAYEELLKDKQMTVDRKNKQLAEQASSLRKEALPYAKASKQTFEIDLEDIEFFGLNDDDAPAPTQQKRKRRTKAEMEAARAEESAA